MALAKTAGIKPEELAKTFKQGTREYALRVWRELGK